MPVLRRALLAAVAALLVLGAAPSFARGRVTLTGTYTLLAKDVGPDGRLTHVYEDVLRVGQRIHRLRLPPHAARPRPGSTVRVEADTASGGTLDVTGVETVTEATTATTAAASSTSVLVILAYWTAPDSVTATQVRSQFFTDDNAWFTEASYGAVGLTGVVTSWLKIPAPTSGRCYDYADQIMGNARAKAQSVSSTYDWTRYDRTVVYFPRCTGSDTANTAGWAFEPGDSVWLNGYMDRRTSVHELGHSYGMGHADGYVCTSGGARVTLGGSCVTKEYGDPFDAMGQSSYVAHFDGVNKDLAGWLGTRKKVLTQSTTTLTIGPYEKPSSLPLVVVANSPTVLSRSYWIEYRQPVGYDAKLPAGATGGVLVRLRDSAVGPHGYLLDATPGDASFSTAVVRTGTSWTAPDGVRIAVSSASASGATVTVSGARAQPTAPSAPRYLTAKAGDREVTLRWTEPANLGNSPLLGYYVTAIHPNGGQSWTETYGETTLTMGGLEGGALYTFVVKAYNKYGTSPGATTTATPLDLSPTIRIVSPASGATVRGELAVDVEVVTPTGSSSEVTQVLYDLGGVGTWTYAAPWDATVPTAHVPNGARTLTVYLYDSVGRVATASVPVTVDNVLPEVAITAPAGGTTFDGDRLVVEAAASMPAPSTAAVRQVYFYDTTYGYDSYIGVAYAAPWRMEWDVTQTYGTRRLVAVATGTDGTSRRSAPVDVTIAHPPPKVTMTAPGATARGASVTLAADATATAAGASVWFVDFYADSGWVGRDLTAPYTTTWDTSGLNGTHTVYARATETSGRSASSPTVWVRVDNVLPVVSVATGASVDAGPVTLTGTARPGAAGAAVIDHVDVTVGGVAGRVPVAADGTWRFDWDATGLAGWYNVTAVAYDTDGLHRGAPGSVNVVPPVPDVHLLSPAAGSVLAIGVTTELAATAVPAAGDTARVSYVCFVLDGYYGLGCAWPSADGTFRLSWWPEEWRRGTHTVHPEVRMSNGATHRLTGLAAGVTIAATPKAPMVGVTPGPANSLTVAWTPAYYNEPVPFDHWEVTLEPGGATRTVDAGPVTFSDLRNGTRYLATVRGVNAAGTGAGGNAAAVAGTATRLTGVPGATAVTYGTRVSVSSALSEAATGAAVAGHPVDLYTCTTSGTRTCSAVAHGTTSSTGRVTLSYVARQHFDVEMRFAGDDPLLPARSSAVRVSVRAVVTSALTATKVRAGTTVRLYGHVYPPVAGGHVYLQRYYGGAWHSGTMAIQTSTGYVSLPLTKPKGTYVYRLLASPTTKASGAASPSRTLTVY